MNWFINLKTSNKLFCGFGLIILLLAVAIGTAYRGMIEIEKRFNIALVLGGTENNFNAQRVSILRMFTTTDKSAQDSLQQDVKDISKESDDLLQKLRDLVQDDTKVAAKVEEYSSLRTAYVQTRDEQVIPLIVGGKIPEAQAVSLGIQQERFVKMRDLIRKLGDASEQQALQAAGQATMVLLAVGAVSLLVSLFIVFFLSRIIATPLNEISGIAGKIASGDLTVNVSANGRADEVGMLSRNFSRMTSSLQEMAGLASKIADRDLRVQIKPQSARDVLGHAFSSMVDNLRRTTGELSEGVNVLASSASEILAATTQVASGAAETGTAISETTATVEEVKQTAQVASQKAKYVSDTAQKATQIGQAGRKSVDASIEGMKRIQSQMESIAESVVKLSEQGQAIGEIIASVNDLAEQSNLLAVNAAIEAAKAGDQGKGFAVVAQEVKSLAEQSKQATAQVRGILGEIQKATTAAVLATEQGSKAVEAGVKQSAEASESIRQLADSITESAQAAAQIAASSQQQVVGTDQVAMAMENIKQASAQNVAGTKQAETAAHNLHDLGQKLKLLVEQYKV